MPTAKKATSAVRLEHFLLKRMLERLLLVRDPDGEHDLVTGRRRLTYSRRFLWTACVVAVVANGAFGLTMLVMRGDPPAQAWAFGIFGLLWLAAMTAAWDALWTEVAVSPEGIHVRRGKGALALVPWEAIAKVHYSRLGSWFVFRAPGYPTVRVSVYRNGLRALADMAREGLSVQTRPAALLLQEMSVNR